MLKVFARSGAGQAVAGGYAVAGWAAPELYRCQGYTAAPFGLAGVYDTRRSLTADCLQSDANVVGVATATNDAGRRGACLFVV